MLTEEDGIRQTVSEISSLYKCDNNKVQFGEMKSETRTKKTAPEQGLHAPYTEKFFFAYERSIMDLVHPLSTCAETCNVSLAVDELKRRLSKRRTI